MVLGKFAVTFPFPRSRWLKTKVSVGFFLAVTWLLEGLSKQSFGFVNSEGYLAIEASRWRLSQTTCYGNAFAVRPGWKYPGPGSLSRSLRLSPVHTHTSLRLTWSEQGWEEALCSFSPLSAPPAFSRRSPVLTPHHSPQTSPSEQNSWTGEGFPAGLDLSCTKMTHLLKKLGKREK